MQLAHYTRRSFVNCHTNKDVNNTKLRTYHMRHLVWPEFGLRFCFAEFGLLVVSTDVFFCLMFA